MMNTKTTKKTPHFIRTMVALVVMLAMMAAIVIAAGSPALAASNTFTVTNTNDGGAGSLRQAILNANNASGADTVEFDIPATLRDPNTGVATIAPRSQLPAITHPVKIDGYSQSGASPNTRAVGDDAVLKIELDGTDVSEFESGLEISDASNSVIRGLVINRFGGSGITIHGDSVGNRVEGNFIGTDPTGTIDRGNTYSAVNIFGGASKSVIGGSTPGKRNVLSGNDSSGIFFTHANGSVIGGNYIGTDKSGKEDLGNVHGGVTIISGSANNTLGGTTAASRNVISGNDSIGVDINGSRGTKVLGNRIGTTVNGKDPLGNDGEGVFIIGGSSDNRIGDGTAAGSNTIAFNYFDGVMVFDGTTTRNEVSRNSIFSNGGLGIDLLGPDENRITDFSNPNDAGDADSGPNGLQNTPLLTSAKTLPGKTTIKGKLNSTPGKTFTVRLFSNPSGANEGEKFLEQKTVTTDRSGTATFAISTATRVPVGRSITATATGAAGTSEFSAPRTVIAS